MLTIPSGSSRLPLANWHNLSQLPAKNNTLWISCQVHSRLQERRYSREFQKSKGDLKLPVSSLSPVKDKYELKKWTENATIDSRIVPKSGKAFGTETEGLTELCQKQVNFWHSRSPLTDENISTIKRVAKLALLTRNADALNFVKALRDAKDFHGPALYDTAQTIFRPLPDATPVKELINDPEIFRIGLHLRRRLFYCGLLVGHVPSALSLWGSISYESPEGQTEKEFILRCLDDKKLKSYESKIRAIAEAVKADTAGDASTARDRFLALKEMDINDFDLVWKKRIEYLSAEDEFKALHEIRMGSEWFPAPVIVYALEQLLNNSKNDQLRIRTLMYLAAFSPKYTFTDIAQQYEQIGDRAMAREYHEIGGILGNKESQNWTIGYLEEKVRNSWLKRKMYTKLLNSWRQFARDGGKKGEIPQNS